MSIFLDHYYPVKNDKILEVFKQQWEAFANQGLELLRSRTDEATLAGVSTEFTQISGQLGGDL